MNQILKSRAKKARLVWGEHILKLCGYIKNYSGELIRGSLIEKDYIFYNEREWRFVPTEDILNGNETDLFSEDYLSDKDKYNNKIRNITLSFTVKDISYVIVKTEAEIIDVIKYIKHVFSDKCTVTQLEVLLTKIHSIENIITDF